jgi:hypothetical protein
MPYSWDPTWGMGYTVQILFFATFAGRLKSVTCMVCVSSWPNRSRPKSSPFKSSTQEICVVSKLTPCFSIFLLSFQKVYNECSNTEREPTKQIYLPIIEFGIGPLFKIVFRSVIESDMTNLHSVYVDRFCTSLKQKLSNHVSWMLGFSTRSWLDQLKLSV